MVRTSQATVYSIDLALHRMFNKDYSPIANTTLNEKFKHELQSEQIPSGTYPSLQYFVIGIGGNNIIEGNNKYNFSEHSPLDGALFNHIPFIVRPEGQDLSAAEAEKYRLRVVDTEKKLICYYAKVMPSPELKPFFYSIRTIRNGTSVSSPTLSVFDTENNKEILNPVSRIRELTYDNNTTSEYVTKIGKVIFSLDAEELNEIDNVLKTLSLQNSDITEIGICSGLDRDMSGGRKDCYACQIMYHVGVNLNLALALAEGTPITKTIEIGGSEPLLR